VAAQRTTRTIGVRLAPAQCERLARLAAVAGLSGPGLLRALLEEAEAPPRLPVPTRVELLGILGGLARSGSVHAADLLLREQRRDGELDAAARREGAAAERRLSRIDELASRRLA
jgi:hypothetical protein